MTRTIWKRASRLLPAFACVTAAAAGPSLTEGERHQALRYLFETRAGVTEAVKGLSPAQWKFKPGPDRWSVAEVVEHLALIEDFLLNGILANLDKAPAAAADRDPKAVDAMIVAKVPDRSTKFEAPPPVVPTGRWTPSEALEHFLASRAQTVELLKSKPGLREHAIDHPVLGPLDGYQWVLAAAAHSARHTKQILEVKADPNFPAN